MKSISGKILTILACITPNYLAAQKIIATQTVTFALTETSTAPALRAKDATGALAKSPDGRPLTTLVSGNEFSSTRGTIKTDVEEIGTRMAVQRISNREILLALLDAKVITDIIGYSIVYVTDASPGAEGDDKLMLVHRTKPSVDISDYISFSESETAAEAVTKTSTTTEITDLARETSATRTTISETGKRRLYISFFAEDDSNLTELVGVNNWSVRSHMVRDGASTLGVPVPGAASIIGIVGSSGKNASEESGYGIIEGRITASNSTVVLLP